MFSVIASGLMTWFLGAGRVQILTATPLLELKENSGI